MAEKTEEIDLEETSPLTNEANAKAEGDNKL